MESSTGQSETRIIASTNVFQIEKIEKIGKADYPKLIEISLHLAKEYGKQAVFTKASIEKYFSNLCTMACSTQTCSFEFSKTRRNLVKHSNLTTS